MRGLGDKLSVSSIASQTTEVLDKSIANYEPTLSTMLESFAAIANRFW
jgi:hypothetical protein